MIFSVVDASEEKIKCDVVATVFGINICMEDIKEKNDRLKAKLSNDELHSREGKMLAFKIRSIGI